MIFSHTATSSYWPFEQSQSELSCVGFNIRCFHTLRQLRSIRRSVPRSVFQSLIAALVLTKLDFGNATLAGILSFQLNRLQAVMNGIPVQSTLSHHSAALSPALVTCVGANFLQASRASTPMPPRTRADLLGRRPTAGYWTTALVVPPVGGTRSSSTSAWLWTIGDRAFPVAAAKTWNSLPPEVTSTRSTSSSSSTFRSKLKTYLFSLSFTDLVTVKWLKCILHYST